MEIADRRYIGRVDMLDEAALSVFVEDHARELVGALTLEFPLI